MYECAFTALNILNFFIFPINFNCLLLLLLLFFPLKKKPFVFRHILLFTGSSCVSCVFNYIFLFEFDNRRQISGTVVFYAVVCMFIASYCLPYFLLSLKIIDFKGHSMGRWTLDKYLKKNETMIFFACLC